MAGWFAGWVGGRLGGQGDIHLPTHTDARPPMVTFFGATLFIGFLKPRPTKVTSECHRT